MIIPRTQRLYSKIDNKKWWCRTSVQCSGMLPREIDPKQIVLVDSTSCLSSSRWNRGWIKRYLRVWCSHRRLGSLVRDNIILAAAKCAHAAHEHGYGFSPV